MGELWWDDQDAEHIRSRSARYPGADNIEPDWTLEAATDPYRVVHDPDPEDWSGVTAWKTRGPDLREYLEGKETY
ncbi:MAG: hypothetical protein ACRDTH_02375 [Pseudonocardiaceae bacterium]